MADELKGRHIDYRDEAVGEAPWGPDIPVHRATALSPGLLAALRRYHAARAARRRSDDGDSAVDAVDPVSGIDPIGDTRL